VEKIDQWYFFLVNIIYIGHDNFLKATACRLNLYETHFYRNHENGGLDHGRC
jgi:hypothetical protein